MTKTNIIKNYLVDRFNYEIYEGKIIKESYFNFWLNYYSIPKSLFDKKVKYEIYHDNYYDEDCYKNFEYIY